MPICEITGDIDLDALRIALSHTRYPPNETVETLARLTGRSNEILLADPERGTFVRFHLRLAEREVVIPYWLWGGSGDPKALMLPAFREAMRRLAIIAPVGVSTWPLYGDLPTEAEALAMQSWFGGPLIVAVFPSPYNPIYTRAESTVAKIATALREIPV